MQLRDVCPTPSSVTRLDETERRNQATVGEHGQCPALGVVQL